MNRLCLLLTACCLLAWPALAAPVPFLCQAPHANWAQPWQDACEEAAIIMAVHWVNGYPLDKESGNQEILGLVNYQVKRWGGHHDLTAARAAQLLRDYYKIKNYQVVYNFDVARIKQELAAGKLVIAPMAGRLLGNKYYRQPGPAYHYLVFIGDDEAKGEFITNDPGTKRGKGYRYRYDVAYNAIHDWTGDKETIAAGRRAIIVITK
ncbi:MAG: C39 family peptidase [Candidatus Margulisbacteria bacterium]|jgi:hypothetical protein|nr:C39 family peptidase [Candidatus Margulisiibacteriota bacterium]